MTETPSARAALAEAARLGSAGHASGSLIETFLEQALPQARLARSVSALREADLLNPDGIAAATPEELAALTGVPASASRGWARRLITLASWAANNADRIDSRDTESLREELRGLPGIGPQLADHLLRDGLDRLAYPLDRGTYRFLARHGWIEPEAGYDEARAFVESAVQSQDATATLRAVQDGLSRIAKKFCRARVADCATCPLNKWLPSSGPQFLPETETDDAF